MTRKQKLSLAMIVMAFMISCNLTTGVPIGGPTIDPQTQIAQAIAGTQLALTQTALSLQLTQAGMVTNTPQATYTLQASYTPQFTYTPQPTFTPQYTYTPQFTDTPGGVRVSVSVNTNCRTGPGDDYPIVGALQVGQFAEVVGRSQYSDSWIIRLPSNPAVICWLWAQYATVIGNTAGLPIYQAPPTQTPTTSPYVILTIINNSVNDIYFVYFSLTTEPWGVDRLGADILNIGEAFSWTIPVGRYDVKVELAGHVFYYSWMGIDIFTNKTLIVP
jgi:hypothetical protein